MTTVYRYEYSEISVTYQIFTRNLCPLSKLSVDEHIYFFFISFFFMRGDNAFVSMRNCVGYLGSSSAHVYCIYPTGSCILVLPYVEVLSVLGNNLGAWPQVGVIQSMRVVFFFLPLTKRV